VGTQVYIDGAICDGAEAKISVFDRGFLYGDSVYEVMRTSGGHLVDWRRHIDRLGRSAASIALEMPAEEQISQATEGVLKASGNAESYLRIVVTRGAGEVGLDTALADASRLIVIAKPLTLPPDELYARGAPVWIVGVRRTSRLAVDPAVKSGNYLNNILALAEARKSGGYEALMCDAQGWLAEGSSSNVFLAKNGAISTPELSVGLLPGITRRRVMELAAEAGIEVSEGRILPDELASADEAFLTSSVRGVLPIGSVDGTAFSAGAPGTITRRLMDAYQHFLESVASGAAGH
jgi:branched-chain amino acid aminotransferase